MGQGQNGYGRVIIAWVMAIPHVSMFACWRLAGGRPMHAPVFGQRVALCPCSASYKKCDVLVDRQKPCHAPLCCLGVPAKARSTSPNGRGGWVLHQKRVVGRLHRGRTLCVPPKSHLWWLTVMGGAKLGHGERGGRRCVFPGRFRDHGFGNHRRALPTGEGFRGSF